MDGWLLVGLDGRARKRVKVKEVQQQLMHEQCNHQHDLSADIFMLPLRRDGRLLVLTRGMHNISVEAFCKFHPNDYYHTPPITIDPTTTSATQFLSLCETRVDISLHHVQHKYISSYICKFHRGNNIASKVGHVVFIYIIMYLMVIVGGDSRPLYIFRFSCVNSRVGIFSRKQAEGGTSVLITGDPAAAAAESI